MKSRIAALAAAIGLIASVATLGLASVGSSASAEEPGLPGMCSGRTDANIVLNAHANGSRPAGVPKFILNISTDEAGHPTGTMILGQGEDRLLVQDWCRFWQHQPGSGAGGSGQCEEDEGHDPDNDVVNAHVVGIASYKGEQVLVRADVRDGEEGRVFRVRYRAIGTDHEEERVAAEEDGCEDESWTRIPLEGWLPLAQLRVRSSE